MPEGQWWLQAMILWSFLRAVVSTCQALLADPGGPLSDKVGGRQGLASFPNILNKKEQNILQK